MPWVITRLLTPCFRSKPFPTQAACMQVRWQGSTHVHRLLPLTRHTTPRFVQVNPSCGRCHHRTCQQLASTYPQDERYNQTRRHGSSSSSGWHRVHCDGLRVHDGCDRGQWIEVRVPPKAVPCCNHAGSVLLGQQACLGHYSWHSLVIAIAVIACTARPRS